MRKFLKVLLLGLLLLLIQSLMGTFLTVWYLPDLLLILVVYLGVRDVSRGAAMSVFLLGLLLDLYLGAYLGPWAAAYVLIYGLLVLLSKRVFVDSVPIIMIVMFLTSIISCLVYVILAFRFQPVEIFFSVRKIFLQALMTSLAAPFGFWFFLRLRPESAHFLASRNSHYYD